MNGAIPGFDYRAGQERSLSASEWRREIEALLSAGGRRHVENGETFVHLRDKGLQVEVYGVIRTNAERR